MGVFVGQTLYCKNGETVIIHQIIDKRLFVIYKGRKYEKPLDIIGKTLFVNPYYFYNNLTANQGNNKTKDRVCKNCMDYKNDVCIGHSETCSDFRYSPPMTQTDKQEWPTTMQGGYLKQSR